MKKSWLILTLLMTTVGSALLFGYSYSTALNLIRERPPLLYIQDCHRDTGSLILSWDFEAVKGRLTPDQSGNHLQGILGSLIDDHRLFFRIPQPLRSLPLPHPVEHGQGKGLEFNGRNWVRAENSRCFTGDRFTLAIWIWKQKEAAPTPGDFLVPTIVAKSNWPSSGWWLCTQPNTNNLDMAISWGEARKHIHSGYTIPPEEWHHVVVTMDKPQHEIQFFIDGKLFGEKHEGVPDWLTNWDQDLYVGEYDGTARWPWHGRLDNFRLYGTVLTPNEIQGLFAKETQTSASI